MMGANISYPGESNRLPYYDVHEKKKKRDYTPLKLTRP